MQFSVRKAAKVGSMIPYSGIPHCRFVFTLDPQAVPRGLLRVAAKLEWTRNYQHSFYLDDLQCKHCVIFS
jgi:hypothetical protein